MIYQLKAKNARDARIEAGDICPNQPKTVRGFDASGECVYIGLVRECGNRAPTASASKGDDRRNYSRFEAEVKESEDIIYTKGTCTNCGAKCYKMETQDSRHLNAVSWCEKGHVIMFDNEGRRKLVGDFSDEFWSH